MKNICKILVLILSVFLFQSCKKNKPISPTVETTEVTGISGSGAISGGAVTNEGSSMVVSRGVCWGISTQPDLTNAKTIDGTGLGVFISNITDLQPNTKYYVRAYALNFAGTAYGDELSFTTLGASSLTTTDYDGNVYTSINIGTQTWLKENLKTTKYSDGGAIPYVTDALLWASLTTDAFCWLNNDEGTYKATYGALYNWYSVNTGKLCPTGWHVPSDAEVTVLTNFLGGIDVAGGKMKEVGTTHWNSPNTGATNSSGFTSLAAGQRHTDGTFGDFGLGTGWWTSTPYNELKPWYYSNWYSNIMEGRGNGTLNNVGLSIRCVKD